METECPFLKVCGPASIYQLLAQREFPGGDPQRNFIARICSCKYLDCEYYKIRAAKEVEKNETE